MKTQKQFDDERKIRLRSGSELARPHAPEHVAVLDVLKDQLLIVLIKRLGGSVDLPVAEVDDTGQDLMLMSVTAGGVFHFEVRRKS